MKKSLSYLMAYLRAAAYSREPLLVTSPPKPVITISRQMGALGTTIGEKTAEFLTKRASDAQPWVVVDKELAHHVMKDHHLSEELCSFLTEEQAESTREHLQKIVGLKPAKWTAVEKMVRTMMHLAQLGNVILIGRAGNIVTADLPQARHVRLVRALEQRVRRMMEIRQLNQRDAEALVRKTDYDRARFVSTYFHADIEDPTRYHLVLNTDRISIEKAVELIISLLQAQAPHVVGVERLVAHVGT